jgi:selenocysteine lyase/cysteine desulfurase
VAVADPVGAAAFLERRGVQVTRKPQGLRIATHFYNDERDLETCCQALRDWRAGQAQPTPLRLSQGEG